MSSANVMQSAKRLDHFPLPADDTEWRTLVVVVPSGTRYVCACMAAIEGLRNDYFEYAMIKAQEMQQVRRDEVEEGD
uniref:Uncharacterized protein n=1 Tax=Magallana gigas TaxID=29159 RepID=K1QJD6_MAGGI